MRRGKLPRDEKKHIIVKEITKSIYQDYMAKKFYRHVTNIKRIFERVFSKKKKDQLKKFLKTVSKRNMRRIKRVFKKLIKVVRTCLTRMKKMESPIYSE